MYRALLLSFALLLHGAAFAQTAKPARPAITGLSHMTFYADDLAKSQQFYVGVLGWEQVPAGAAAPGVRFYANHEQYIELQPAPVTHQPIRFSAIGFSTPDADALRRYLGASGVAVPTAVTVDPYGNRSFQVQDPEGNKVEFTQQGPHPPQGLKAASTRVSGHIIHGGFVAHDRARLDRFYKDVLGFHLYWEGGSGPGHTDWVMMQVPDGTDWMEYMLYLGATPTREALGSAYHFAPGVVTVADLQQKLKANGWTPAPDQPAPLLGVDAKWQFDLHDPDGTRVEFMEFAPVKEPCCSKYTGPQPTPSAAW
jgi:catechol 2,3-dioxygenase-like lactoylglutathione lyase family enzyme